MIKDLEKWLRWEPLERVELMYSPRENRFSVVLRAGTSDEVSGEGESLEQAFKDARKADR